MPPANDLIANATSVTTNVTMGGTTVDATAEAGENFLGTPLTSASVWYEIVVPLTATEITISVTGADYAYVGILWRPSAVPATVTDVDGTGGSTLLGQVGDGGTSADDSTTFMGLTPGETLYLYMGDANFFTFEGSFTIEFDLEEPPVPGPGESAFVTIDGVDVTSCCVSGSWTRRLNRPSTAQVRVPMDCAVYSVGSRLKIEALVGSSYEVVFHGMILLAETEMDEDAGYTVYNATDPMELWQWRPARDGPDSSDPGDFSKPIMFQEFGPTAAGGGPEIIRQMLLQSEDDSDPGLGEGPLFLDLGTFETGGCDVSGAPVDWPMTIMEVVSLLTSTGCVDVVITPTDPGGGVMGTVDVYNGDYGTDLSGSISFDYGQGNYNVRALRWNEDMTNMCNKLWYFMGPRILTPSDPAGDQHWCYNVQGDDPGLPDPIPNGQTRATLLADRLTSRSTYGTRMEIQIFDAGECDPNDPAEPCCGGDPLTAVFRELYRNRWETESWIRLQPRELIHITPIRNTEIGTFDVGDIVGVSAVAAVRGGFSGAQRVYEYTVSWDENSVLALSELQTSPTADG